MIGVGSSSPQAPAVASRTPVRLPALPGWSRLDTLCLEAPGWSPFVRLVVVRMPAHLVAGAFGLLLAACSMGTDRGSRDPAIDAPLFVEVGAEAGLDFVHRSGATGEFYYPELLQPGCAFLDFDNDSFLDVYLIQGGSIPARPEDRQDENRLYRNRGDGTFEDVTITARVGDRGYGVGVAVADYDRDGDVDLYVTNLGPNTLYRNNGDGTFEDVTRQAGVGDDGYSTCAAFLDYDADGDLDLYVCNYLAWSTEIERPCHTVSAVRDYCSPGAYDRPQPDILYRNNGDGSFTDVSEPSGIRASVGTGLGVVCADFDSDGRVDVYVANDQMPNSLWINNGDGTFRDEALVRGCALNESGRAEAGMGIDTEDVDHDGDWDLFMVHLDKETNTFYRNTGGLFQDTTDQLKLGGVSQAYTGFGVGLFDYDSDGHFDIFIANGRVRLGDSLKPGQYEERNQLLRGSQSGAFEDVSSRAGEAFTLSEISRGAAFGDYDNDGDVDILVSNNDGPVRLLRNEARGQNSWISVQLVGGASDRDCIGARVEIEAGGTRRQRLVQPAYSYCSSSDPRVHFGLGDLDFIDTLTVTWPGGRTEQRRNVPVNQFLELAEPPEL